MCVRACVRACVCVCACVCVGQAPQVVQVCVGRYPRKYSLSVCRYPQVSVDVCEPRKYSVRVGRYPRKYSVWVGRYPRKYCVGGYGAQAYSVLVDVLSGWRARVVRTSAIFCPADFIPSSPSHYLLINS